ncbi:hypothetical protein [Planktothrix paucivesiculata]|uniref:Uncharacterized protein n=1 Tax=Planktothrix paucivesiculata PCC 9631 TaxID=671071 RepID=A0A7Z9BKC3_9CYAN|nr:hypothetical protein [Planktothrix paucivesiculata]VXD14430.1 exported hypothetical protein [Planktothrix paucivesiculata PCC 9631]
MKKFHPLLTVVMTSMAITSGMPANAQNPVRSLQDLDPYPNQVLTSSYSTSNYDATGTVKCSANQAIFDKECEFGVLRGDSGSASVSVNKATNKRQERILNFDKNGVTTPQDGKLTWEKIEGNWWIGIDNREFYLIPEIVIFGD